MDHDNNKPKIFITLFEKQLVRSYLLSDNGDFIKKISTHYNIQIITSPELQEIIRKKLIEFQIDTFTSVTVFKQFESNLMVRIICSILRFSNNSPTTFQVINLQKFLGSSKFRTALRFFIYYIVSRSMMLKSILRLLHHISINSKKIEGCFYPKIELDSNSILFISSLFSLRGQDIPIGVFFRKNRIKIIGTVRSWDNLSVNGALPFIPDFFLCHSNYMKDIAIYKQGFRENKIIMSVTPSYQSKFLVSLDSGVKKNPNFAYMCQGLVVNPDDNNFVRWLIDFWIQMPISHSLTIIQHPSFIMKDIPLNLPSNIKLIVFKYDETTLSEYYQYLSKMDLVFGGGTTGLLDASFVGVPIIAVKFEIVAQNFWESSLRHFDYFPWTADFFDQSNTTVAKSKAEFESLILNYREIKPLDRGVITDFTGNSHLDFSKVLLQTIKQM